MPSLYAQSSEPPGDKSVEQTMPVIVTTGSIAVNALKAALLTYGLCSSAVFICAMIMSSDFLGSFSGHLKLYV